MSEKNRPNQEGAATPASRAHRTARWSEIIFRALSARVAQRWHFVSFRGPEGAESRGVVDILAIRKNTSQPCGDVLKRGDLFDIVLIQLKGGSARAPTKDDCRRLREVARFYRARAVCQFCWRKGTPVTFLKLTRALDWRATTSKELFG